MKPTTTNERLDKILDEVTKREVESFIQESIERHKAEAKKAGKKPSEKRDAVLAK